jgi:lysozyme
VVCGVDVIVGCDLSRYNESFDPDTATEPIDFAIQKATQGMAYVDKKYEEIWQGVKKVAVRGAYHYQDNSSWLAQADHFLETAAKHDYHIYALDLEEYDNEYTDTFFADAKRIIDHWRANARNKTVILYTNGSTYDQLHLSLGRLYGLAVAKDWLNSVPLWIASPTVMGAPVLPKYRKDWFIHQYSWSGSILRWGTGGTRVDENIFNGTREQFQSYFHLTEVPQPPDEPTNEDNHMTTQFYRLNTTAANIRTGPGTNYQDIGDLRQGDVVQVVERLGSWSRFTVAQHSNGTPVLVNTTVPVNLYPGQCWSTNAYFVAVDALPNPQPEPAPEPPAEGSVTVSVEAEITATIDGRVYVGTATIDNVELVER